jgi:hypothetical protein
VNRERLMQNGTVIYLHALPEMLRERTRRSRHRPLLMRRTPWRASPSSMRCRDTLYREVAATVVESSPRRDRSLYARARGIAARSAAGMTKLQVALASGATTSHVAPGLIMQAGALLSPSCCRNRVR